SPGNSFSRGTSDRCDRWSAARRFRSVPRSAQDPRGVLSMSFPPPLLAMKWVVWHTLTGDYAGEEDALLAQLRLPPKTSSKRIPPDKSILFPGPPSLPCAPVGGT